MISIKNISLITIVTCALMSACNKPDKITLENEGTLYMATAVEEKAKFTLFLADTAQTIAFGAAYSGLGYPGNDIPVSFTVQKDLINAFNQENETEYLPLPESAYTIQGLTSVIKTGKTTSVPLTIAIITSGLDRSKKYMLPIKMDAPSGSKVSSNLAITYFRLENIVRRETDITDLTKLTVSQEHRDGSGHGEGSPKLVDGSIDTKFLLHVFPANFWAQLEFTEAKIVNAYTLTSGNDASERDPKNWRIMGSNNGTNWELLDSRGNEGFAIRKQTRFFEFENTTPYKYYRLHIDALNGNPIGGLFQLAEWRVITFY
ncbi:MAG TPA: DUF1735 domain-containing protein [Niabella sp.]|nr:DUF1735 domain-containing protein [Niabella sp.]